MNLILRFFIALALSLASRTQAAAPASADSSDTGRASETEERTLSPLEISLVGSWFTSGDANKHAYIARAGSRLFTIDENNYTLELYAAGNAAVIVKRPEYFASGVVNGDFIQWSNGAWWSRHPVPALIDVSNVWGDDREGWINLKSLPPSATEGCSYFREMTKQNQPTKVDGNPYLPGQFVTAHAPAAVTYTFEKPVTEFRSVIALSDGGWRGNVVFKARTDAGIIYTSGEITQSAGSSQTVRLKFAPTKSLQLVTDPVGDLTEDWAVWLAPQAR